MMLDDEDVASFVASIVVSLSNSSIIPKHGFEIMLQFERDSGSQPFLDRGTVNIRKKLATHLRLIIF